MTPEAVIDEVNQRGPSRPRRRRVPRRAEVGGHPQGARRRSYVIVNADEGDPGAYMDRSLLEGNPHSVIEGLMIGGYAIGAPRGLHLRAPGVPAGRRQHLPRARPAARRRASWEKTSSARDLHLRHRGPPGRGGLRLRRIERPHERHRGAGGRAAAQVRPHVHLGRPRQAELPQQRRDLGQRAAHHQQGRRLVRLHRHGALQGHQDLLARGQGEEHAASSRCPWA